MATGDSDYINEPTGGDSDYTNEPTGWDSDYTNQPTRLFEQTFVCLPFSKYKSPHLETGDKIIMPASSLPRILSLRLKFPLTFQVEAFHSDRVSHCGVLEFEADEGCVHMPDWMMKNLRVEEGDCVILRDASLSKASFMKLRPHAAAFADEVWDLREVMEGVFKNFACVSRGDTIVVGYNGGDFWFDVVEVAPGEAVCLIDTDCAVDFDTPVDYEEEVKGGGGGKEEGGGGGGKGFVAFTGIGRRLDGEAVVAAVVADESWAVVGGGKKKKKKKGGEVGGVREKREKDGGKEEFRAFTGRGRVLGGGEGEI